MLTSCQSEDFLKSIAMRSEDRCDCVFKIARGHCSVFQELGTRASVARFSKVTTHDMELT